MRIVAADDKPMMLDALVSMITEIKPFCVSAELLEYAKKNPCDVLFFDAEMENRKGMELAKQLKTWYPDINIVFVAADDKYMKEAIQMRASGYISKPLRKEDVQEELENLRNPVIPKKQNILVVKCFGTFDVFVGGESLVFERSKAKEMLAYLIDRRGSYVISGELRAVLWENTCNDQNTRDYFKKVKRNLIKVMEKAGAAGTLLFSWNKYAIDTTKVSCDYLEGKPDGESAFNGEYMSQYSWGEVKNIQLRDREKNKKK